MPRGPSQAAAAPADAEVVVGSSSVKPPARDPHLDWLWTMASPSSRVPFSFKTRRFDPAASGCGAPFWIDVGAHRQALTGTGSTFAFEPQVGFFNGLVETHKGQCVFPINAAAGPSGPSSFQVSQNGHSSSLLATDEVANTELTGEQNGEKWEWGGELKTISVLDVMVVSLTDAS